MPRKLNRLKKIIVAIDGFSSCGKSTLAKALGKALHYAYIDTGAMYRAVALYFLENKIDYLNLDEIHSVLPFIEVHFERRHSGNHIFLNGKDVENEIRQMRISEMVSQVAAISEVRRALVRQQQEMGKRKGIVMDGRDIGTVVFPEAEVKIFLTADVDVRARRRMDELSSKGEMVDLEVVKNNLLQRDHIDSTRSDSPLRQAEDSILIDNTFLDPDEQLMKVLEVVRQTSSRG